VRRQWQHNTTRQVHYYDLRPPMNPKIKTIMAMTSRM
jgi:hypothetical protein